jgi:hypothetical protein
MYVIIVLIGDCRMSIMSEEYMNSAMIYCQYSILLCYETLRKIHADQKALELLIFNQSFLMHKYIVSDNSTEHEKLPMLYILEREANECFIEEFLQHSVEVLKEAKYTIKHLFSPRVAVDPEESQTKTQKKRNRKSHNNLLIAASYNSTIETKSVPEVFGSMINHARTEIEKVHTQTESEDQKLNSPRLYYRSDRTKENQ